MNDIDFIITSISLIILRLEDIFDMQTQTNP